MIKVVGIRFQRAGKIYYFDPLDYDLETAMTRHRGDGARRRDGNSVDPTKEVDDDKVVQPFETGDPYCDRR